MPLILALLWLLSSRAFAATTPPTAMSNESAATYTLAGAAKYCADLNESAQTDWYLPVVEDLIHFSDAADTTVLWTRSPVPLKGYWVVVRLSDGRIDYQPVGSVYNVRCVR